MTTKVDCPKCDGYGYLRGHEDEDCELCNGSGMASEAEITMQAGLDGEDHNDD